MTLKEQQKEILQAIFYAAIHAVAPDTAVLRHIQIQEDASEAKMLYVAKNVYPLSGKNILVLGAGKGAAPMALAVENLLHEHIHNGFVVVKYDHGLPLRQIHIAEAAHPVPDMESVKGASSLLSMAQKATAQDIVLCLFTGGASALTALPAPGIDLDDVQNMTTALLQCGAHIHEINALRKHTSAFSGGQLAKAAMPAKVVSLIVSDVIGDDLDVIASGPTMPDSSTFATCIDILKKYFPHDYAQKIPVNILQHLTSGVAGHIAETPKPEDAFFSHVQHVLVATNEHALEAAAHKAQALGFDVYVSPYPMQGEAKDVALKLLETAQAFYAQRTHTQQPFCFLAGGETTVTLQGKGRGGRNQEMALAASIALHNCAKAEKITALFAGTDGSDGPTDAAGGFACATSYTRMQAHENPEQLLNNNDSYKALTYANDLFITGPTRTNVMDIAIIIIVSTEKPYKPL